MVPEDTNAIAKVCRPYCALNIIYCFVDFFTQSRKGELYEMVCDGCATNCTACNFKGSVLAPQCTSLVEAGIEHANSSGGLSTVEDLYIFKGYWRATKTSTDVKKCYHPAACSGGLTTGKCNAGYKGPCERSTKDLFTTRRY